MADRIKRDPSSHLLIIEDDEPQLQTLTHLMGDEGFEVTACSTADEALAHVNGSNFGVAIVDLRLADPGEAELLERLRGSNGQVRVIIHTGSGSYESAKAALNLGAFAYVEKPSSPSELIGHVHRAFRADMNRRADKVEAAVAERTAELSKSLAEMRRQVAQQGETEFVC